MSSKGYATPLRLEVGSNPQLQRLYLAMALAATVAVFSLSLPFTVRLIVVTGLLYAVWHVWQQRAELGGSPVQLVWDGEQQWWWSQQGREQAVELQGDSYLTSRLVVLNFLVVESGRRSAVVLTPAALGEEMFRRMRVRFQITPQAHSPE
jgi:hypothetical protein